jgi:hypothetical protein
MTPYNITLLPFQNTTFLLNIKAYGTNILESKQLLRNEFSMMICKIGIRSRIVACCRTGKCELA